MVELAVLQIVSIIQYSCYLWKHLLDLGKL